MPDFQSDPSARFGALRQRFGGLRQLMADRFGGRFQRPEQAASTPTPAPSVPVAAPVLPPSTQESPLAAVAQMAQQPQQAAPVQQPPAIPHYGMNIQAPAFNMPKPMVVQYDPAVGLQMLQQMAAAYKPGPLQ
jgi:hypothetical protein